jgi:DivIVA domain-containing protein
MTGDEVRAYEFHEQFRGYNPNQVDQLLQQIADALDGGRPISELMAVIELRRSMRGYRMSDVDEFLEQLRLQP